MNKIKNLQTEINCYLSDFSFVKKIKDFYTFDSPISLGLWGAEPTLNLDNTFSFIQNLLNVVEISSVTLSSNFTTDLEHIFKFIEQLKTLHKKIDFSFQISIDGPDFITDMNRGIKTFEKIDKNLDYFIEYLNRTDLENITLRLSNKATWSKDTLIFLDKNLNKINDIDIFYSEFISKVNKIKNKNVISEFSKYANMSTSDNYTKENGIQLSNILKYLEKNNYGIGVIGYYDTRFKMVLEENVFKKFYNITCSALKNSISIGLDYSSHLCHRTFFSDVYESDEKSIITHQHFSNHDNNTKTFSVSSYHLFPKIGYNINTNNIIELARSGEIDKKYLDSSNASLLSYFSILSFLCPVESFLQTSCFHSIPIPIIKLLGNGALEIISKRYFHGKK
jgi:sulfatase maturation enzyme AslB (radical SAM superfamily)